MQKLLRCASWQQQVRGAGGGEDRLSAEADDDDGREDKGYAEPRIERAVLASRGPSCALLNACVRAPVYERG